MPNEVVAQRVQLNGWARNRCGLRVAVSHGENEIHALGQRKCIEVRVRAVHPRVLAVETQASGVKSLLYVADEAGQRRRVVRGLVRWLVRGGRAGRMRSLGLTNELTVLRSMSMMMLTLPSSRSLMDGDALSAGEPARVNLISVFLTETIAQEAFRQPGRAFLLYAH